MNRDLCKPLLWLMWLALPATALDYWQAWDRLPERMAVHFNAEWQPNGFATKQGALELGLGIMVVMLVLFTTAGLIAQVSKPSASWPMLVAFYVALGFLCYGNYSIVRFNLNLLTPHPPPASMNVPSGGRDTAFETAFVTGGRYVRDVTHG